MALALLPGAGNKWPPTKTTELSPLPNHCPGPEECLRQQDLGAGTPSTPWGRGGWGPLAMFLAEVGFGGGGGPATCTPPWLPLDACHAVRPHGTDRASGGWMDGQTDGRCDGTPKYIATLEASGRDATGMAPTSAPQGGGCHPIPVSHGELPRFKSSWGQLEHSKG